MPPNYFCRSRWLNSVEDTGLEPVTSCVQDKRSPKTELIPQIKTIGIVTIPLNKPTGEH